jgi:hypothetical protein
MYQHLLAARFLGQHVGSTAPLFLAFLAVHVVAGTTAVITGATAALATCRPGAATTAPSPSCPAPARPWPSCAGGRTRTCWSSRR